VPGHYPGIDERGTQSARRGGRPKSGHVKQPIAAVKSQVGFVTEEKPSLRIRLLTNAERGCLLGVR